LYIACKISVQVPGIEIQGGSLCKNKKERSWRHFSGSRAYFKEQLDKALKLQKKTGQKLGVLLVSEGIVTQEDIMRVLEEKIGVLRVALEECNIDPLFAA